MVQGTSPLRNLGIAAKSAGSALRSIVKEGVHRLVTHFQEWPKRYIEMRAALYDDCQESRLR